MWLTLILDGGLELTRASDFGRVVRARALYLLHNNYCGLVEIPFVIVVVVVVGGHVDSIRLVRVEDEHVLLLGILVRLSLGFGPGAATFHDVGGVYLGSLIQFGTFNLIIFHAGRYLYSEKIYLKERKLNKKKDRKKQELQESGNRRSGKECQLDIL